ncbi:MAG: SRPBCC family protein [Gemmataceae bacterium]|nr:SRPBCC family protein [Gemmataceae bacterium]
MSMWIGIAVAALVGLFAIVWIVGSRLPRDHVVSRGVDIAQPPEAVWRVITDTAQVPTWWPMMKSSERLPDRDGHAVWKQIDQRGNSVLFAAVQADAPQLLVQRIVDDNGPFAGEWRFELTPTTNGCHVTVTEHGSVALPIVRFMFRMFMDPALYLDSDVKALARKCTDS